MVISKNSVEESVDYLDFVEEHSQVTEINLFEKVKVMTSRAKDLYAGKTSRLASGVEGRNPIALAQYEMKKGLIEPNISEKEEQSDYTDDLEYE